MLVVEPERRYSLKQILQHRWMSCQLANAEEPFMEPVSDEPNALDTVVITNMLQLPNLTFDEIADSIHNQSFNHIYAIYNLLVDKLRAKRREQQRLQHHTNLAYTKWVWSVDFDNNLIVTVTIMLVYDRFIHCLFVLFAMQSEEGKHHDRRRRTHRKHQIGNGRSFESIDKHTQHTIPFIPCH